MNFSPYWNSTEFLEIENEFILEEEKEVENKKNICFSNE
jgi:hypothetical protein